ncbi:2-dehydropantoate 2-reductase [Blastococcus aurantiacus]|uniref:2-dehydropantoate 2-reductase n=1 Tax=Blastococcus aurantiacus TaxID=1550231 RepID=A0A1G7HCB1_9ACTN|nr:2-dehydropantoate 2-reductase [Blastococcus aurantiacus]SDE98045.1 2-dehydropantoate 2-reductase [Blastococcus aurantiacus]
MTDPDERGRDLPGGAGPMRVAVLGPGAVGGLLGALLAAAGHTVICLAAERTARHVSRHGLRVGSDRFGELAVHVGGAVVLDEPVDACLVTVKAVHLGAALDRLAPERLGGAVLVPLLNGVEHVRLLRDRFPATPTVAASVRVSAARTAPGVVHHRGHLATVDLAAEPRADGVAAALAGAGLDVRRRPEAELLWDKLCFLAPLALLTTSEDAPLGRVRQRRAADLRSVVEEVAAVARAEGVSSDGSAVLDFLGQLPEDFRSSMQLDAAAGVATELDAIGGAVLRAAGRHGVDVPVTAGLVAELGGRPV